MMTAKKTLKFKYKMIGHGYNRKSMISIMGIY